MADDDARRSAYTVEGIPTGLYRQWQGLVSSNERLGDRIILLLAADLAVSRDQGMGRIGLLEVAQQEGLVSEEQIQEALTASPPDEDDTPPGED